MATLDQVEKLRQYASVSYEKASEALAACNDDMLDAIVYLEKQGKVKPPVYGTAYTTQRPIPPTAPKTPPPGETSFGDLWNQFKEWVKKMFKKITKNYLVVKKKNDIVLSLPIIIVILLIVCAFWVSIGLLILGLFFGFSYSFEGKDITDENGMNDFMNSASQTAEDIKYSVTSDKKNKDDYDNK